MLSVLLKTAMRLLRVRGGGVEGEVRYAAVPRGAGDVESGEMPSWLDEGEGHDGCWAPKQNAESTGGPEVGDELLERFEERLIATHDARIQHDCGHFEERRDDQTLEHRLRHDGCRELSREELVPEMVRNSSQTTVARHRSESLPVQLLQKILRVQFPAAR
eukprot:CAMPEP_0198669146 /NCGR_PEP_ID=MMETSP1467-20131203/75109_1 /TAXON_ID=1462469 /ORGANISM="unid. sp., Strain CCMP2135" /LENGTH=160 /DNA_ID=CAMNT_0044405889 /DNA_START=76 /DNA_END=558 /DNA_ORIENTATION=+